jgi:hypothetical protein
MTAKYEATVVSSSSIQTGKSTIFPHHSHAASNCDTAISDSALQQYRTKNAIPCPDEAFTSSQKSIFSNKFNLFVSKGEEHKRRDKEKEQKRSNKKMKMS